MTVSGLRRLALAVAGGALLFAPSAEADETGHPVRFAPPKRIMAGDAFAGAGRLYPSPVLHDVNGDGRLDLVVGDLPGRVTVALRTESGFLAEKPLEDGDNQPLKFHNW